MSGLQLIANAGMLQVPPHADLLIAGAGPTGLALSAELRRRGVCGLIMDRLTQGENTCRAAVVHAHTLEVLEPLGVSATLIAEGVRMPTLPRSRP